MCEESLVLSSKTLAMLAVDAVETANSGHPGMPMGAADIGVVLWLNHLQFNPKDPDWINRDRFVLSNGHGSMFLYGLLHLSGYDVSLEDLKHFRQLGSKTPGHPEFLVTPGVECTTGPLGQGIGNAVGMALGAKMMAARYNTAEHDLFNHKVFCFVGDGCLMEGISNEAASLAGHLGLGNLIVMYDDNHITIAGETSLTFSENVPNRFEAMGWHVCQADGCDFTAIDSALTEAKQETSRPSLISFKTEIGRGSPGKANTAGVHGAPLGADEVKATKEALGWPLEPTFHIPKEVYDLFGSRVADLRLEYERWQEHYEEWRAKDSALAEQLDAQLSLRVSENLEDELIEAVARDNGSVATRKASEKVLQKAAACVNSLVGGSADLEPSTLTVIKDSGSVSSTDYSGRNIHFGVREHAMGAVMNGLSYYGSFIPFGSTFLCFVDYMKPAIRLAALSHLPAMFIFSHDSFLLGEDGPTHQPVEHINSLRMLPNVYVFRPADAFETAVCYAQALERRNGPSVLILTRQSIPALEKSFEVSAEDVRRGGYLVFDAPQDGLPQLVLVGTGSEVALAISTATLLRDNYSVRVVSMPCCEAFSSQSSEYQEQILPRDAKKVVIEAGTSFGWKPMISDTSGILVIGLDYFGASANQKDLAREFGFVPDLVAARIKEHFTLK